MGRFLDIRIAKAIPYIVDFLASQMDHIFRIKALIPQLVHQDLIERKIFQIGKFFKNPLYGKNHNGFALLFSNGTVDISFHRSI